MPEPDVTATPQTPVPTTPVSLDQSLSPQTPGGLSMPGTPVPAAPVPPPQAQDTGESGLASGLLGHALGKAFRGLQPTHNEYAIDPATGKTITTQVKTPATETFRGILAAGLLGARGIGPKEGEYNFSQGLLAGLGGGVQASQEAQQRVDSQRREQAQQQYVNQLKAAQEDRENKKLTMEQQLNAVSIADHNQNIAARAQMMEENAYNYAKQKGADIAQPLIDSSHLSVSADKPMVDGYESLGIEALDGYKDVTPDMLQKYLKDHPGATAEQVALHTGTQTRFDPATGKTSVEDLYSIYPPMTKVPPALLQEMKSFGADKPGNSLNVAYKSLTAKGDGNVNPRDLMAVYRDLRSWEGLQADALNVKAKQAEINERNASAWRSNIEARSAEFDFKDKLEAQEGAELFGSHFDPATNTMVNMQDLTPIPDKDAKGNPVKLTPQQIKQNKEIAQKRDLVTRYAQARYAVQEKDYYDHAKEARDKDTGQIVTKDPVLQYESANVTGLANAINTLQTLRSGQVSTTVGNPATQLPQKISLATQGIMGISPTLNDALVKVAQLPTPQENPQIGVTDLERKQIEAEITKEYQSRQQTTQNIKQRVSQVSGTLANQYRQQNPIDQVQPGYGIVSLPIPDKPNQ